MYGTQACSLYVDGTKRFENDVKMYGTQAAHHIIYVCLLFENDVKMYGTQAYEAARISSYSLRMM